MVFVFTYLHWLALLGTSRLGFHTWAMSELQSLRRLRVGFSLNCAGLFRWSPFWSLGHVDVVVNGVVFLWSSPSLGCRIVV